MSGPSRAEIIEMQQQWRGLLSKFYPGQAPESVCSFYADLTQQLRRGSGSPDLKLREMGRLLKGHLDMEGRGLPRDVGHMLLLAGHHNLSRGHNLQAAKKAARRDFNKAVKDPKHALHDLLPKFKDSILQDRSPETSSNLGQLLREQLAEARPASA